MPKGVYDSPGKCEDRMALMLNRFADAGFTAECSAKRGKPCSLPLMVGLTLTDDHGNEGENMVRLPQAYIQMRRV